MMTIKMRRLAQAVAVAGASGVISGLLGKPDYNALSFKTIDVVAQTWPAGGIPVSALRVGHQAFIVKDSFGCIDDCAFPGVGCTQGVRMTEIPSPTQTPAPVPFMFSYFQAREESRSVRAPEAKRISRPDEALPNSPPGHGDCGYTIVGSRAWFEVPELTIDSPSTVSPGAPGRNERHYLAISQRVEYPGQNLNSTSDDIVDWHGAGFVYKSSSGSIPVEIRTYFVYGGQLIVQSSPNISWIDTRFLTAKVQMDERWGECIGNPNGNNCGNYLNHNTYVGWKMGFGYSKTPGCRWEIGTPASPTYTSRYRGIPKITRLQHGYFTTDTDSLIDQVHVKLYDNVYYKGTREKEGSFWGYQEVRWSGNVFQKAPATDVQPFKVLDPNSGGSIGMFASACGFGICRGTVEKTPCCASSCGGADYKGGLNLPSRRHIFNSTSWPIRWNIANRGAFNFSSWESHAQLAFDLWGTSLEDEDGDQVFLRDTTMNPSDLDILITIFGDPSTFQAEVRPTSRFDKYGIAKRPLGLPAFSSNCSDWAFKGQVAISFLDESPPTSFHWSRGFNGKTRIIPNPTATPPREPGNLPALRLMVHEVGHALGLDEADIALAGPGNPPQGVCLNDNTDLFIMCQWNEFARPIVPWESDAVDTPSLFEVKCVRCFVNWAFTQGW